MPYDTTVIDPTRMGGYSIKSRINYHFALYYNKFICSRFHIKTGISYFNRKDYYEWNPDTVKKYYTNKPWYYTRLLNENYSSNSMDIPVFIGYKYQSLDVMLGIKFNVISFIQHKVLSLDSLKTKHTYISYFWEGGSFGNHVFYPSFIIQYTPKKLRRVSFYFSADMRRIDYFDLQIGINLKTNKLP
ncbi:MAG: hypothetical protein A2X08_04370 [Bacteroidetes bacterium GWA2_32_17]|nr:MAG: hypothetical protein A2X08_04370 [Bacteroidetes bacterium GWA2_32_17]